MVLCACLTGRKWESGYIPLFTKGVFTVMKKIQKKKGFTLVEIIVVLVIITILAALLIPSLNGYITKANNKALETKTRQAVMAAQTLASEKFAMTKAGNMGLSDITSAEIVLLAETGNGTSVTELTVTGGKVISLTLNEGGNNFYYKNGVYSVSAIS